MDTQSDKILEGYQTFSRSIDTSPEVDQLFAAIAAVQGEVRDVVRDAQGRIQNRMYQYATIAAIKAVAQDVLLKHGVSIWPMPRSTATPPHVEILVTHTSGQWRRGTLPLPDFAGDPKALGSWLTHCRRYAQREAMNISDVDDDGDAAGAGRKTFDPADTRAAADAELKVELDRQQDAKAAKAAKIAQAKKIIAGKAPTAKTGALNALSAWIPDDVPTAESIRHTCRTLLGDAFDGIRQLTEDEWASIGHDVKTHLDMNTDWRLWSGWERTA